MRMLNKISNKLYPKGGVPFRYEVKKKTSPTETSLSSFSSEFKHS